MLFIQYVLQYGPTSPKRVLNSVVGKLTGKYPYPMLEDIPEMNQSSLLPQDPDERRELLENTSKHSWSDGLRARADGAKK